MTSHSDPCEKLKRLASDVAANGSLLPALHAAIDALFATPQPATTLCVGCQQPAYCRENGCAQPADAQRCDPTQTQCRPGGNPASCDFPACQQPAGVDPLTQQLRERVQELLRGNASCVDDDGTPFASARTWREGYGRVAAERDKLWALLQRCRPIVESEMALMDSMARHMAGGFDPKDVQSADDSADFHYVLLRDIDAALGGGNE